MPGTFLCFLRIVILGLGPGIQNKPWGLSYFLPSLPMSGLDSLRKFLIMSLPGVDLGRFPGVLVLEARGDPAIQIKFTRSFSI